MVRKKLFFILLLQLSFTCFAQSDSTAYQRFYANFETKYRELSTPPLQNMFGLLSLSARFSFYPYDPLFINVLKETMSRTKADETSALDSLFFQTFADLRLRSLWISNQGIYDANKKLFSIYNDAICPCLTSKVKKTDFMDKMLAALNECMPALMRDTAFLNKLRAEAGNSTLNEIYKLQQHATLYFYQHCGIVNLKFNETIFNEPVFTDYMNELSYRKAKEAEDMIRHFKNNRLDSLSMLFPGYKKYIPVLSRISGKSKEKGVTLHARYIARMEHTGPRIFLSLYRDQAMLGEATLVTNAGMINSLISSISYNEYKKPVKNKTEVIEEIREDVVIPKETKKGQ